MMRSRFAAVRVRVAHRDYWRNEPHPEQWLLIEWPTTEKEPTKYWLSNLHESITLRKLVAIAKLRWRIERDYEELKQELGLGHFEGRNWRGFHHHATLSIAAYSFLVLERRLFPPQATRRQSKRPTSRFTYPACDPTTRPEALPIRTERHNPQSITTLRRQIATHLARSLPRCPCCLHLR
jgi:SRSO17 transposase